VLPGCGHVPMADDPEAVTAVITETTRRAVASNRDTGQHERLGISCPCP